MNKVLFLDFDGVLNTNGFLKAVHAKAKEQGRKLLPIDDIDPSKVIILNRIVKETSACIVLSTSWRELFGAADTADFLFNSGFEGRVIGSTPNHIDITRKMSMVTPRWLEIHHWILANKDKVSKFAIIDDLSSAGGIDANLNFGRGLDIVIDKQIVSQIQSSFFQTDEEIGLTDELADKIIQILEGALK
jgi:RNase P/RNase MRP subunit p29